MLKLTLYRPIFSFSNRKWVFILCVGLKDRVNVWKTRMWIDVHLPPQHHNLNHSNDRFAIEWENFANPKFIHLNHIVANAKIESKYEIYVLHIICDDHRRSRTVHAMLTRRDTCWAGNADASLIVRWPLPIFPISYSSRSKLQQNVHVSWSSILSIRPKSHNFANRYLLFSYLLLHVGVADECVRNPLTISNRPIKQQRLDETVHKSGIGIDRYNQIRAYQLRVTTTRQILYHNFYITNADEPCAEFSNVTIATEVMRSLHIFSKREKLFRSFSSLRFFRRCLNIT